MGRTSKLSWFILLLAPLTLCWKLLPNGPSAYELTNEMVGFLSQHGYSVTQRTIIAGMPVIHAESDSCKIVMVEISPEGWSRDIFAETVKSMDRKFVVFDGRVYPDQPTWLTVTSDRWSAYLRRLGIPKASPPVIGVAETSGCDAERLPWNEFLRPQNEGGDTRAEGIRD